ncbi:hypothetical protein [Burkholderia vietnamiensis]|uniref:hypothetical protein n=2 Tax=Burkholderia vietnamiensis TaxID=60552 RepID=UPI00075DBD54|nr:hypothetical protein [Burkholderia vietnamiensis]KVE68963.1 hypothetical protein WI96_03460 [Burkholderia vietnamiensis]MCA8209653.1 hypothetical protein [Burkholderia vietnamiensis]HDR9166892.1 hypothetical protein [Burkholderia vietnamiensis]HDR9282439.1 hypothetical protein [Burkholderia vietnamiensis]
MKKKEPVCPLLGKPCVGDACMFWVHMIGQNPQTGHSVDQWDCSVRWLPMLLVENARQARGAQAAVESMRNEVVGRQDTLNNLISQAARRPQQIRDVETPPSDQISDGRETKPQSHQ